MSRPQGIITVGGHNTATMLENFFWRMESTVPVYPRVSPELVADALKAWQHPLCIVEHTIPVYPATMEVYLRLHPSDLLNATAPGVAKAYDLLPEWIECSPTTRFIITYAVRASGVGKERVHYKKFKQVIRVIGFLDTKSGYELLYREVERIWGIRKKPPAEFQAAYEEYCRVKAIQREAGYKEYRERMQRAIDNA